LNHTNHKKELGMNTPTKSDNAAYVGAEGVSPASASGWTPDNGAGDAIMNLCKLGASMGLDAFDLLFGWVLGFGILVDLGCGLISAALWGKKGWVALLEVLDITEVIDMWCPTCTIIAVTSLKNGHK
jgi:hypothetical protein